MKLPWNRKYLIIAFHVIVTILAIYVLKYGIDFLAYILQNLVSIRDNILSGISWIISNTIVIILAFVFSYLLDPVVEFFQIKYDMFSIKFSIKKFIKNNSYNDDKYKEKTRFQGTLITYIIIFLAMFTLGGALVISINRVGSGSFIENLTLSVTNSVESFQSDLFKFYEKLEEFSKKNNIYEDYIAPKINDGVRIFTSFLYDLGNNTISIITAFGNGTINVLLSLVVCFYFLKDKHTIKKKFSSVCEAFLPKRVYSFNKNVLSDIHAVFSGYIRGTLLDASIMSVLISMSLYLIGVRFSMAIGIIAGFSNVIPYFGALMGFSLAIIISIVSGEPMQALYSTIAMFILQQIDTVFIVPKVVGESVKLSPILVIIALSIAGNLFGLWGMVFAVPVFATLKLFATRMYDRQITKKNLLVAMKTNHHSNN